MDTGARGVLRMEGVVKPTAFSCVHWEWGLLWAVTQVGFP